MYIYLRFERDHNRRFETTTDDAPLERPGRSASSHSPWIIHDASWPDTEDSRERLCFPTVPSDRECPRSFSYVAIRCSTCWSRSCYCGWSGTGSVPGTLPGSRLSFGCRERCSLRGSRNRAESPTPPDARLAEAAGRIALRPVADQQVHL